MSVTYVGDTSFEEMEDASLSVDAWGIDTLTRKFKGANTGLQAFLVEYAKDRTVADSIYPYMFHNKHTATIGRAFTEVTIEYKGMVNWRATDSPDDLPPVISSGVRATDASIPYIGNTLGQTTGAVAEVTFMSPYTRVMYVTRERPIRQKYRNFLELTEEGLNIVSRRGSVGNIKIHAGKTWKQASEAKGLDVVGVLQHFNGVAEVVTTQFEWAPAGQWFEVTETNEARVFSLDAANGLLRFFP
jgi:hypothetical protein